MTFEEVLKNPLFVAEMKKQGLPEERITQMVVLFKEISSQAVQSTQQTNANFEIGKFHQFPAVYFLPPTDHKIQKKENFKNRYIENTDSNGATTKVRASAGFDDRVEFPPGAFTKEEVPLDGKMLQAIQVKKYIMTGGLLTALHCTASGQSFCQSLTEFRTETTVSQSDGMTFIDHLIIPLNSTLAKEGYMNREEIEKIISLLK